MQKVGWEGAGLLEQPQSQGLSSLGSASAGNGTEDPSAAAAPPLTTDASARGLRLPVDRPCRGPPGAAQVHGGPDGVRLGSAHGLTAVLCQDRAGLIFHVVSTGASGALTSPDRRLPAGEDTRR